MTVLEPEECTYFLLKIKTFFFLFVHEKITWNSVRVEMMAGIQAYQVCIVGRVFLPGGIPVQDHP